LEPRSDQTID